MYYGGVGLYAARAAVGTGTDGGVATGVRRPDARVVVGLYAARVTDGGGLYAAGAAVGTGTNGAERSCRHTFRPVGRFRAMHFVSARTAEGVAVGSTPIRSPSSVSSVQAVAVETANPSASSRVAR